MREIGVDLSDARTQLLTQEMAADVQWLITMGCGDECPVVPGVRRDDWPIGDPKGKPIEYVRDVRDEIRMRVHALIEEQAWSALTSNL